MPGGMERMADAIARGRACKTDLLEFDFFDVAGRSLETVRVDLGIPPKSEQVLRWDAAGASVPLR